MKLRGNELTVGGYYVNTYTEEGCNETYILHILPPRHTMREGVYWAETMAVHLDNRMWVNEWPEDFFKREATSGEIALFKAHRNLEGSRLKGVGEVLVGRHLNGFDGTYGCLNRILNSK